MTLWHCETWKCFWGLHSNFIWTRTFPCAERTSQQEFYQFFDLVYTSPFLSDVCKVRKKGYYRNSRIWNGGKQLIHTLSTGVDFPEPGETVTSCFAVATWHLIGGIDRNRNQNIHLHKKPRWRQASVYRCLLTGFLYCQRETFIPTCRSAVSASPPVYHT